MLNEGKIKNVKITKYFLLKKNLNEIKLLNKKYFKKNYIILYLIIMIMLILFLLLLIIYKILNKIWLMNGMLKISNSNHDKNLFLNNKTALLYEFSNKIPIINNLIISFNPF